MRSRPIGSVVGAIGGLIFVVVNAAAVPAALLLRVLAVVTFVAVIWFAVLRAPKVDQAPPSRAALRTYGLCILGMLVALFLGARVLSGLLDRPHAVVPWVVLVVGAHFLPFAGAFGLPIFRLLAVSLVVLGLAGLVLTLSSNSATVEGWTGVAAGFVLLLFAAIGPRLSHR